VIAAETVSQPFFWTGFAAVFTALGGLAAAGGAIAAWKAASASREASREARRALAAAIRPDVTISLEGTPGATDAGNFAACIENVSSWDAYAVEVEASFHDGRRELDRIERLQPGESQLALNIDGAPYREERHLWGDLARVTVRFWDGRSLARYEKSQSYFVDDPRVGNPNGPLTRMEDSRTELIAEA
jgi:hypothetical protein